MKKTDMRGKARGMVEKGVMNLGKSKIGAPVKGNPAAVQSNRANAARKMAAGGAAKTRKGMC
jgi:hypothetical protein